MSYQNCEVCNLAPFKYTCPRCNIIYCSVACYKSQKHLKCSEEFYKECVQEELRSASKDSGNNTEDMRKMYDILKRIHETDAGIETENFDLDGLDSDDNKDETSVDDEEIENCENVEYNTDDEDIAERLKGVDINNANEVWQKLNSSEKEEFKNLISSGDIMKIMPVFTPWWLEKSNAKVVVIKPIDNDLKTDVPKIIHGIPKYSSICSKEPAPCLHYNLWNILAAYSCTVRYFNGEHITNPNESTAYLINLSSTLKYGTNFEEVEDAIISVEMEALTTGNGATQLIPITGIPNSLLVENRTQLTSDTRQLMSSVSTKLSALSDIFRLLKMTKRILETPKKTQVEFQKLFAFSSGMEELTRLKVQQIKKKIKFYMSYVDRENDLYV